MRSYRTAIRNTTMVFTAVSFAVALALSAPAYSAEMQVLGAAPAENAAPDVPVSQRLILHDVLLVRGNTLQIDPSAKPVLDYAARLLRENPTTLVYVSGKGKGETVRLKSQAVADYLKSQGISGHRLILEQACAAENGSPAERSNADIVVLNLTGPQSATCTS
jgi:hypothetical protein